MRYRRSYGLRLILAALVSILACGDSNLVNDASFDNWCGKKLCAWTLDEGSIERVATWHAKDYGVSLASTPTQISQLSSEQASCIRFDLIADVAPEASVSLTLDFNDDAHPEFVQLIPSVSWKSLEFLVHAPLSYHSLRYVLRKEGTGRAVLAQVRAVDDPEACKGKPLAMDAGSLCDADDSCASGACIEQHCSACADTGTCSEGAQCKSDDACQRGACVGGFCNACGKQGSCAANLPCDAHAECARGRCIPDERPSAQVRHAPNMFACAECTLDEQCAGAGFCLSGHCVSCRDDQDCGEGELCRWQDALDAGERKCVKAQPAPRPRGSLCDVASDCSEGLACAAGDGMLKRCGNSCLLDPAICWGNDGSAAPVALCTAVGVKRDLGIYGGCSAEGFKLLPLCVPESQSNDDFAQPQDCVFTCFPSVAIGQDCTLDELCLDGFCCQGVCSELALGSDDEPANRCSDPAASEQP